MQPTTRVSTDSQALRRYLKDLASLTSLPGGWVTADRRQIASFLGLPEPRVRVTQVSNGGAFGAKEDLNVQCHTALIAHVTGRPALLVLSRAESLRFHPKRCRLGMQDG